MPRFDETTLTLFVDGGTASRLVEREMREAGIGYRRIEGPIGWDRVPGLQFRGQIFHGTANILGMVSRMAGQTAHGPWGGYQE